MKTCSDPGEAKQVALQPTCPDDRSLSAGRLRVGVRTAGRSGAFDTDTDGDMVVSQTRPVDGIYWTEKFRVTGPGIFTLAVVGSGAVGGCW